MFSEHCLSTKPQDTIYIPVKIYNNYKHITRTYSGLKADIDLITGELILKNDDDTFIKGGNMTGYHCLLHYFHMAQLYDPLIKFFIEIEDKCVLITVYLKKDFNSPMHVPTITAFSYKAKPDLASAVGVNEHINNDYNHLFKLKLYNYQQNNVNWMISREELVDSG